MRFSLIPAVTLSVLASVASFGANAGMVEFGKSQPQTTKIVHKMAATTEDGKSFLALSLGDQMTSQKTKSMITITRANRICQKYGYDGVNIPSASPFELQATNNEKELLVLNDRNQLATFEEFPTDMKLDEIATPTDYLVFTGKTVKWILTMGIKGARPQKFTQVECQKLVNTPN